MKYKDYYAILGVKRDASADEIRKAYRKLAQKHHPDVSKEKGAEAKFKDIGEAYQTLKDAEKRAAYDQLGSGYRPGQEFRPPPDWAERFSGATGGGSTFDDLSDFFEQFSSRMGSGRGGRRGAARGADYEATASLSIEDAYRGTQLELDGTTVRIPKGVTDGQRLRLPGRGGKGMNGGPDGDLFLSISLAPHRVYRADGHDLTMDLLLTPWEAALGATLEVPTLAGTVSLKVPAGIATGARLRLSKRGLPKPGGGEGDLYAVAKIVNPPELGHNEKELYEKLAKASTFNPRRL
jgi:curved DNA-binding protein